MADRRRWHRSGDLEGVYNSYQALLPLLNIQRVYKWAFTKRVLMRRGIIACEHVRAGGSHALDGFDEEEVRGWYRRIRPFLLEAYAKYSDGE